MTSMNDNTTTPLPENDGNSGSQSLMAERRAVAIRLRELNDEIEAKKIDVYALKETVAEKFSSENASFKARIAEEKDTVYDQLKVTISDARYEAQLEIEEINERFQPELDDLRARYDAALTIAVEEAGLTEFLADTKNDEVHP